jgi:kynureninase
MDKLDEARAHDARDPLARFREAFYCADPDLIYLDGNSLGRLPLATLAQVPHVVESGWGGELVRGWSTGWWDAPIRLGDRLGQLLGAAPGQVVLSDSTSVNLFKLCMAALALRPGRTGIVSDALNFPSDLYVLQGCARLADKGHTLHVVPSADGIRSDRRADGVGQPVARRIQERLSL